MKSNNILDTIKGSNITIPYILLKNSKDLNINYQEIIFLSFLMQNGEKTILDVESFSKKLAMEISDVMSLIGTLTEKKLVAMEVSKNNTGMMVEYLDISVLYVKLVSFLIEKEEISNQQNFAIYEVIEKEFGRTLSPYEYETIKGWLDSNLNEDLIKEALKEAVLNGVTNLKYIDKILYNWNRKGWTKPTDVKRKVAVEDKKEDIDIFEYDWLEDND